MKKLASLTILLSAASSISHAATGWISSDRFGYSGTITRYSDPELTTQEGDVISTGAKDLSLWSVPDAPGTAVMGSWWYSTAVDGNGDPVGPGVGNEAGNGIGFIQYRDAGQAYVVNQSYVFDNFDGTYWTDFTFSLDVAMTTAGADSRLVTTGTGDEGYFRTLNVSMTATGLQGIYDPVEGLAFADELDTYATGVTGTISGVFVNTSATVANNGYYAFNFALNMDNWAYANRDDLVGDYPFQPGGFAGTPIPEPATMMLLGLGLGGLCCRRSRKA